MARIRAHIEEAPNVNVIFEIASDSENHTVAGVWNEWGPNLMHPRGKLLYVYRRNRKLIKGYHR